MRNCPVSRCGGGPCANAAAGFSAGGLLGTVGDTVCVPEQRVSPSAPGALEPRECSQAEIPSWAVGVCIEVSFDRWRTSALLVRDLLKCHGGFTGRLQHYMLERTCLNNAK